MAMVRRSPKRPITLAAVAPPATAPMPCTLTSAPSIAGSTPRPCVHHREDGDVDEPDDPEPDRHRQRGDPRTGVCARCRNPASTSVTVVAHGRRPRRGVSPTSSLARRNAVTAKQTAVSTITGPTPGSQVQGGAEERRDESERPVDRGQHPVAGGEELVGQQVADQPGLRPGGDVAGTPVDEHHRVDQPQLRLRGHQQKAEHHRGHRQVGHHQETAARHPVGEVAEERGDQRRQPDHPEHQGGGAVGAGQLLHPHRHHEEEGGVGHVGEEPCPGELAEPAALPRRRAALPPRCRVVSHAGSSVSTGSGTIGSGLTVAKMVGPAGAGRALRRVGVALVVAVGEVLDGRLSSVISSAVTQTSAVAMVLAWIQESSSPWCPRRGTGAAVRPGGARPARRAR